MEADLLGFGKLGDIDPLANKVLSSSQIVNIPHMDRATFVWVLTFSLSNYME